MDSDESNSNDDNHHPSKPSSPKRRKIESANLPMQNEERTPITVSDLANRVTAPPQDLQVDLGMRSLVGYVHGQQLQRLQMEQQQRLKSQLNILTSDVPMHSKWSTQEISNALVSKDINVPRPADHYVPSQAELEYLALRQKELPFGISTTPSSQLLSQHPLVVEEEDSKGSMSTTSPSTAARESDIDFWILDGREILISFGKFPYYLCDRTKHSLVASFFLHTKHHEYARCNSEPHHAGRSGILLSGPTGSAIYQEKLAMALAHHFSAKFLVLCKDFYPAIKTSDCSRADLPHAIETYEPWIDYPPDLIFDKRMSETIPWSMTLRRIIYPLTIGPDCSTMGVGPSHDAVWTHFRKRPIQSLANPQPETNYQSFNRGDRVVFVGLNFGGLYATDSPRGPTFGSLGEIVYTAQSSYLSKLSVRFDKPIREGLDLGGICKAGYGFYCNANELFLDPKTLEDFDKSIINDYLEAITCASRDSPFILFMEDVGKFLLDNPEAYLVIKYLINKLPENVVVLGSHTPRENNKGKESYFRKRWKHKKLPETAKLLSELFPNKISIEMPEVGKQIAVLKHQFSEDAKVITAEENLACLNHVLIQSGLDCDELEKLSVMDPVLIQSCLDCDELEKLSVMDQRITYESAEKVVRWAIGHQLMEYPQSTANSPVLSIKSIEYGISVLRETQTEKKSSKKSLKDVVTANVFETNLLSEVILPEETGVTFDDVGALENVKDTLRELVMLPLQRPELFSKGQLRKPCKGILLFGPPGTGKTMLAKAIATEAGANFINISMSTIAAKWYGDAEKYVRAVFSLAIKIAPSIIFVDEVDSLLGRRGSQEYEVSRRIKNEFMVNWDGLRTKDGERVMVLAATNRPFDIDEAVIRRMPRRFMVNLPNASNRSKILRVILEKEELAPDVDFHAISSMTDGYSGSDLKNLCVTAAYCPIRDILQTEKQKNAAKVSDEDPMPELKMTSEIRPISMEDFKYAREQIRASSSTESTSLIELLEWNERYGEGASRGETTLSYFM